MSTSTSHLERWLPRGSVAAIADQARDLAAAAQAALAGARAVMRWYRRPVMAAQPSNGADGPVTRADRASHASVLACLGAFCPEDDVLSEEGPPHEPGAKAGRLWIVDPLDGTREFLDRRPEFSVMVGLARDGRAVLGAVCEPDPARLYLGIVDVGAWRIDLTGVNPQGVSLRCAATPSSGIRLLRSRSHPDERITRLERALAPVEIVPCGSVGVKCARIADGRADLYVHPVPYLKEWDTCAPEAILRGAGGRVTDCHGTSLGYAKPNPVQPYGIFASTPDVWPRVASTVGDFAKEI